MKRQARLTLLITGLLTGYGLGYSEIVMAKQAKAAADRNLLAVQTFYFESGSTQLAKNSLEAVWAHAAYLIRHPQQRVILAGHVDGANTSSQYAIALGEQNAKAVERVMRSMGVTSQQLEVLSFGEDKPACRAKTTGCRQQNNRVEIGYQ